LRALLTLLLIFPAAAQVGSSTLSGVVTDSSGAVLVGATIQVKNVDTNVSQSTVSDNQGRYRIPDLPIGTYEVQASMTSFRTAIRRGVLLTVGSSPVIDFSLMVGAVAETVTIEGQAPQVETETSAISALVTSEQIRSLPLNGRNFSQLIAIAPGVQAVPPNPGVAGEAFYGAQENYAIAGGRPEGQAFLVDNTDVSNFWNHAAGSSGTGYSLGVEAIAEFQVITNTYGAQFGGAGAVMNAATKSGTNQFHGSAYEFLRNSALDARDYFDLNADGSPAEKPPYRRNQFGGSFGGPIKKDKLFVFGNYEGSRESLGTHVGTTVPQPYVAQGQLPCSAITPVPSGCPATPSGAPGSPTNPIVPVPGAIDASKAIAALFPTPPPGNPDLGGTALFTSVGDEITHEDYFLGRMDYNIGTNDTVYGRYIYDKGQRSEPFGGSPILGHPSVADSRNHFFVLEERHVISPKMINLARFNYIRTNERGETIPTQTGSRPLQFYPDRPDGLVFIEGRMMIGGNQALPYYIVQNKFGGADDLAWTAGAHNLKAGVSVMRVQTNLSAPFELGGMYTFPTLQTFLQGLPLTFLGVAPGQTDATRDFRETDVTPYIQDDWKVRPWLTINAGIRWEYATNPVGVRHPLNNLLDPPFGSFVEVEHAFRSNPNSGNFDPRIGFAIDPLSNHKMSIRGGFGIYHNRVAPRTFASGYYFSPPFANVFKASFIPPFTAPPFPNPFPPPQLPPGAGPITQFAGVNYNIDRAPYQMQYNLNVQYEVARDTMVAVGYVGAQGRNLFTQNDVNPSLCNTPGTPLGSTPTTDCSSPNANFAASVAPNIPMPRVNPANNSMFTVLGNSKSNYNSLQLSVDRRLARYISGHAHYTWAHCLDTGSVTSGLEQFSFPRADPWNTRYDYGRCAFDVRHNFSENALFTFPFMGNQLVEGWQISQMLTISSGMPVNILHGFDNTGLGAAITAARPNHSFASGCGPDNIVDTTPAVPVAPGARQWFDPNCYSLSPFGTLGNVPRNQIDGPGIVQWDAALSKTTRLSESVSLEFRTEFFNLLNHPMFDPPSASIFTNETTRDPTAGQITSTSRRPRQIQFGLKLIF
jgi:outer membrane receptor protein involved in Fe transport